ncbi:MAG: hypothetical protein RMK34_07515 [Tepidimonas sp.]|nr:hypothetical protein [Tepidimonas sp.]
MQSLWWSASLVVLASIPLMAIDGLHAQGLAAMATLTLALWPVVALMRWVVHMAYRLIAGQLTSGEAAPAAGGDALRPDR